MNSPGGEEAPAEAVGGEEAPAEAEQQAGWGPVRRNTRAVPAAVRSARGAARVGCLRTADGWRWVRPAQGPPRTHRVEETRPASRREDNMITTEKRPTGTLTRAGGPGQVRTA